MVRDIRIENHLFWPHIRNTSYEAFFEQLSGKELRENNAQYFAASMQSIDRETMSHAILDLENDLARVLAEMEVYGVHIQKSRLTELEKKLTARISQIEQEVENEIRNGYKKNSDAIPVPLLRGVEEEKYKMGVLQADKTNIEPSTINLSSPLQVQKLLFEVMKIPPIKKTKTGFSVDEETLAIIAQDHEIAEKILEHRHANKLLGTYVRGLLRHIDSTGRVHTTYDTLGASTGRMSSDNPNLQNIPAGDIWSDEIKSAFCPAATEWVFVVADYSQIELRILACLSGDETMLQVFRDGRDLHTETAKFLLQKDDITSAERKIAKTVNFGVMYGITPFGLSKMIPKTASECSDFIERFFTLYPRTREYFDHVVAETLTVGYAETFFGRRRTIKGLSDRNSMVRESAKREAMNMPIQGTCADIMKYSMVAIAREWREKKLSARLIMSVHDELVIECPSSEAEIVRDMMKSVMESRVNWDIPMTVEIGIGKNWREAKK